MAGRRKTITFDLSVEALKKYYANDEKSYLRAYSDSSVYTSRHGMTVAQSLETIKRLFKELPWLKDCVKAMHMHDYVQGVDVLKVVNSDEGLDNPGVLDSTGPKL